MTKFAFVFVCQEGELESMALLLAASIRKAWGDRVDIVACTPIPASRWGRVSATTRRALEMLNVQTAEITNVVSEDYPIANKIDCLSVDVQPDVSHVCFLDSDIFALGAYPDDLAGEIVAVPPRGQFMDRLEWENLYAEFDLEMPAPRHNPTSEMTVDVGYANSGVVCVKREIAELFSKTWGEVCRHLWRQERPANFRHHIDQIALPITAAKLGKDVTFTNTSLNFPSWHEVPEDPPTFYHYQVAHRLFHQCWIGNEVRALIRSVQPDVREVVLQDAAFRKATSPVTQVVEKLRKVLA